MKAILLSIDALVAIGLLLFVSVMIAGVSLTYHSPEAEYQRLYYSGRDSLNVLSDVKMSGLSEFQVVQDYAAGGILTQDDMNKTFIDAIGSLWASGNISEAANITEVVLGSMLNTSRLGYRVLMDGNTIYERNSTGSERYVARLTTVLSGYSIGRPVEGYMSKAYLTSAKKSSSSYAYFGGYEGEGNLTKYVTIPADAEATGAYIELDAGSNFTLYINGNNSGVFNITNASAVMSASKFTLTPQHASHFSPGRNTINLNFTDIEMAHVGGGYIRVDYNTTEFVTETYGSSSERYAFPGIEGIINLFSAFSVPGDLKNLTVFLHYRNNLSFNNTGIPVYFVIGASEVYRSNITGEINVTLRDVNISPNLSYQFISNRTVPIRFGTEEFISQNGIGKSDSVLITDNSGSMGDSGSCDVSSPCVTGLCDTTPPCNDRRSEVAKDADTEFVNTILNVSGNRIGMVAYGYSVCRQMNMSSNRTALYGEISQYGSACGATCTSCGTKNAMDELINNTLAEVVIPKGSVWSYNDSYPSDEPPDDVNGSHWYWTNYTDDWWPAGQAMLGFENSAYSPNVDTNIGNNGGNYFFRKKFNLSYDVEHADLNLLYDDAAEVWLNGRLIYNITGERNGTYWNTQSVIFYDGFETYYGDGTHQVDRTDINVSPGHWYIDDNGNAIYLMCNNPSYPAHGPTDVMLFYDMDAFGYAQTSVNLSNYTHPVLSYWWKMSNPCDNDAEYAKTSINDGTNWYTIKGQTPRHGDDDDNYHMHAFDLSPYDRAENFTIRFGFRSNSNDEVFYIDDVTIAETSFRFGGSYFVKGENVLAVKLRNNDAEAAKFDAELNVTQKRYKAILIMSDGDANYCLDGWDCNDNDAKSELVNKACEAWDKYGIHVYTVAFGNAGAAAIQNLNQTACCETCSHFYTSNNTAGLKKIYSDIANEIANASLVAQIFNVSGNVTLYRNVLYPDSYIEYNFTPAVRAFRYGEISMNMESLAMSECTGWGMISDNETWTKEGWFYVPNGTEVVDAKVTSYSSEYWTDRLYLNNHTTSDWKRTYWLPDFGRDDYSSLGDPYFVSLPVGELGENNSVKIGASLSNTTNSTGGSPDNKILYTLRLSGIALEGYSGVFAKASGSTVMVYYDTDGDNEADGYNEITSGPMPSDVFDPQNDSVDDAFMRLMDRMNFLHDTNSSSYGTGTFTNPYDGINQSNPIDLQISGGINVVSSSVSGVPSMWGPVGFEIRIWY